LYIIAITIVLVVVVIDVVIVVVIDVVIVVVVAVVVVVSTAIVIVSRMNWNVRLLVTYPPSHLHTFSCWSTSSSL
jgi:hypothetical protein